MKYHSVILFKFVGKERVVNKSFCFRVVCAKAIDLALNYLIVQPDSLSKHLKV